MSRPLELSTSSFSPLIAVTASGTSFADSRRRVAVTTMSPTPCSPAGSPTACPVGAWSCATAGVAQTNNGALAASSRAMADVRTGKRIMDGPPLGFEHPPASIRVARIRPRPVTSLQRAAIDTIGGDAFLRRTATSLPQLAPQSSPTIGCGERNGEAIAARQTRRSCRTGE